MRADGGTTGRSAEEERALRETGLVDFAEKHFAYRLTGGEFRSKIRRLVSDSLLGRKAEGRKEKDLVEQLSASLTGAALAGVCLVGHRALERTGSGEKNTETMRTVLTIIIGAIARGIDLETLYAEAGTLTVIKQDMDLGEGRGAETNPRLLTESIVGEWVETWFEGRTGTELGPDDQRKFEELLGPFFDEVVEALYKIS